MNCCLFEQALEDGNLEEATQKGRRRKRRRDEADGDLVSWLPLSGTGSHTSLLPSLPSSAGEEEEKVGA